MCGIAAGYGNPDETIIRSMMQLQQHRGPDGTAFHVDEKLIIGYNRLAIIDLNSNPIVQNEEGDKAIAFNGEIYNYQPLKNKLIEAGHQFSGNTDSEVVLHLIEDYDIRSVEMLDGMFAFFASNGSDFIAARDPFGIKPLYYSICDETIYLASEIKALLNIGKIHEFPPGIVMTKNGMQRYYEPSFRVVESIASHILEKQLTKCVHKMTNSDVPMGAMLSGGLDSSIVATIAQLPAITVGMEGSDDIAAAEQMADYAGIELTVKTFDEEEIYKNLTDAIWHLESFNPILVRSAIPTMFASRVANKKGIKVLLSGEGSDELFAGYEYLQRFPQHEYDSLLKEGIANLYHTELQRLDRMTMAAGIEARVPFMDTAFVEYAMGIPVNYKINPEKKILRDAFSSMLPASIVNRRKMPFDEGSGVQAVFAKQDEDALYYDIWSELFHPEEHPELLKYGEYVW